MTELRTEVHMYGCSLMDIMGYLDINSPLQHVHASPLTLHSLTYLPCLMATSKLSSAAICNKNKHLQGRDKACVNTPVDTSLYCNGLLQSLIHLLSITQRVWFSILMGVSPSWQLQHHWFSDFIGFVSLRMDFFHRIPPVSSNS